MSRTTVFGSDCRANTETMRVDAGPRWSLPRQTGRWKPIVAALLLKPKLRLQRRRLRRMRHLPRRPQQVKCTLQHCRGSLMPKQRHEVFFNIKFVRQVTPDLASGGCLIIAITAPTCAGFGGAASHSHETAAAPSSSHDEASSGSSGAPASPAAAVAAAKVATGAAADGAAPPPSASRTSASPEPNDAAAAPSAKREQQGQHADCGSAGDEGPKDFPIAGFSRKNTPFICQVMMGPEPGSLSAACRSPCLPVWTAAETQTYCVQQQRQCCQDERHAQ